MHWFIPISNNNYRFYFVLSTSSMFSTEFSITKDVFCHLRSLYACLEKGIVYNSSVDNILKYSIPLLSIL